MLSDKQLPIPGLEPSSFLMCLKSSRKMSGPQVDRITFLEKRIFSLEMELAILKIQMEKDYA